MHGYMFKLGRAPSPPLCEMLFVVLVFFFVVTIAAPLDIHPDLSFDLNTSRNVTATNRCSSSPEWQAYAFLVEDCFPAIQRVYVEEVLRNPDEKYEFSSLGTQRRTSRPWIRTPVQIDVGSCTLSIIMLDWFAPRETLPGRGPGGHYHSDTATFRDIWNAARVVEKDCLLATRRPGWDAVGTTSSIGVFLWATDSAINRELTGVRGALPTDLPTLISPNVSDISHNSIDSTTRNPMYTFEDKNQ